MRPRGQSLQGIKPAMRDILVPEQGVSANNAVVTTEVGPSGLHRTELAIKAVNLGLIAAAADESTGKLIFTFPAGEIIVKSAYMSIGLTNTDGNIDADTPELGIGTTVGSGANATLGAVGAAAENILTAQVANNVTGTAEVKTVADQILVIATAGDHTVYLNIADGWAGAETTGVIATGTIVLEWVGVI